jgi:N-acetylmuramoyl-L-alanine amidase
MKWLLAFCLWGLPWTVPGATYEERGVAAVLMGEAWSEGAQGMTAVAEVIHQRSVEKARAPLQIISANRGQIHAFSCLNGTTLDRLILKFSPEPDYQKALQIAQTTCQTPAGLPGLTRFATHYTRVTERPYWARGHRPVAIVGQHAFYRLAHY